MRRGYFRAEISKKKKPWHLCRFFIDINRDLNEAKRDSGYYIARFFLVFLR